MINSNKVLKSICYRIVSSTVTFLITFFLTGNVKLALSIGMFDTIFKIINYYGFDVLWEKIFAQKLKPKVVWLTGLSGSGKTAISLELIENLKKYNLPYSFLDGDEIRKVIKETGFDAASRRKHNLNVAYMASMLQKQGSTVIVSLVSPIGSVRDECREICGNSFVEVFVDTPIQTCINRDVKGLYKKAMSGEIKEFTGISATYDIPKKPELILKTENKTPVESANELFGFLKNLK